MNTKTLAIGVMGGFLVAAGPTFGRTWTATNGGALDNAANWDGATLPSSTEWGEITTLQTGELTLDATSYTFGKGLAFSAPGTNTISLGEGKTALGDRVNIMSGTTLILESGTLGAPDNGNRCFLGDSGCGNTLIVDGPSSVFRSGGTASSENGSTTYIAIGQNDGNNLLLVRNGGTLRGYVRMGICQSDDTNNVLRVTGSGSAYEGVGEKRVFELGGQGGSNRVEVLNDATFSTPGAVVLGNQANYGTIGYRSGDGNVFTASGSGTRVSVLNGLTIGAFSSGNRFELSGGAEATVDCAIYLAKGTPESVGIQDARPCNNSLLIGKDSTFRQEGSGSYTFQFAEVPEATGNVMRIEGTFAGDGIKRFYVGSQGAFNRVEVDGGLLSLTNSQFIYIGSTVSASGNVVRVTNGGTLEWVDPNVNGGDIYVGYAGRDCALVADASTLDFRLHATQGNKAVVKIGASATGTGGRVECLNSSRFSAESLQVGVAATGCRLIVSDSTVALNKQLEVNAQCDVRIAGADSSLTMYSLFLYDQSRIEYEIPAEDEVTGPVLTATAAAYVMSGKATIAVRRPGVDKKRRTIELIRCTGSGGVKDSFFNSLQFELPKGVQVVRSANAISLLVKPNRGLAVYLK